MDVVGLCCAMTIVCIVDDDLKMIFTVNSGVCGKYNTVPGYDLGHNCDSETTLMSMAID